MSRSFGNDVDVNIMLLLKFFGKFILPGLASKMLLLTQVIHPSAAQEEIDTLAPISAITAELMVVDVPGPIGMADFQHPVRPPSVVLNDFGNSAGCAAVPAGSAIDRLSRVQSEVGGAFDLAATRQTYIWNERPWIGFDPEVYDLISTDKPMMGYDFANNGHLYSGDIVYSYSTFYASDDGRFAHIFLVTGIDANGSTGSTGLDVLRWKWITYHLNGQPMQYTVRWGDTIAFDWKISPQSILDANGFAAGIQLTPGQTLTLPAPIS